MGRARGSLHLLWIASIAILIILASTTDCNAYGIDAGRPLSQLRLDSWSVRDGLPSRVINAIVQTPDGFIWLGTGAGLIRFDGVSFDTYNTENTPSLPNNTITTLKVADDGSLWVGTDWGSFGRFANGKFVPAGPADKHWSRIYSIAQDSDGSMWIGEWGDTPIRHIVGNRIIAYRNLNSADPGPNVLVPLGDGSVLCGMPWDAPRILRPDGSIVKFWPSVKFDYPCNDICQARDGSLWYGVGRNGLFRIKGGKIHHFTVRDGLASNIVTKLYEDQMGQIWIGTTNGLSVWNGKVFQSFGKDDGLYDSAVGSLLEDQEGDIWVASGVGLNRFAGTKLCPFSLTVGSGTATTASQSALSPAADGGMWCVTNMGLWRLKNDLVARCAFADPLGSHFEGVVEGPDGHLWLWMDNGGEIYSLWCLTQNSKSATGGTSGLPAPAQPYSVQKVTIHGSAFCAVARRGYLIVFGRDKVYCVAPGHILKTFSFPGTYQFTARQDNTGTIWIGDEKGLIRWKNDHAQIMNEGLAQDTHVLGIDSVDPNRLWLATDHGLARFQNGRSTVFGKEAGLPDTNLFQVLQDNSGRLWLGSNFGIFWISLHDIADYTRGSLRQIPYHAFQAADGIRSFPTGFSSEKSTDGKLWFAGDKGITVADPNSSSFNPVPPPVTIESAALDKMPLSSSRIVTVQPGAGFLMVRFAALSFAAPERVQFRYKLEGLDDRWTDAGNRRVALYPYLPPGNYRFVVLACNNDGVWNMTGASMSFVLLPHYYQTTWFKLLCAAVFVLLLGFIYYIRVRAIVLRNRGLEEKVAERTAQLSVSNEQLKSAQDTLASQCALLEDRNYELEAMHRELEAHNEQLRQAQESLADANAHLAGLAITDGLTGLKNHRSFQEHLEFEWERHKRYGSALSLILLDIDLFKQYNDRHGHQAGDDILKRVAAVLDAEARECDHVARYGGEEFVIILPETDTSGATSLAERIRQAIQESSWPLAAVTASFGVATAGPDVQSGSDLFTRADNALFSSKGHGRNQVTHAANLAKSKLRRAS